MQSLVSCAICNSFYLDGPNAVCPKCAGRGGGVERKLNEPSDRLASEKKTGVPEDINSEEERIDCVCGWLVCSKGEKKGKYFKLFPVKNKLWRENDGFGSADVECAFILYDHLENKFWILNGRGLSLVRVNGALLLNAVELKKNDVIQIGKNEFVFIPLCSERFKW